ncbi:uncharacterized protein SPPG_08933 [Spizellomyces punctatus DAOM BR117]|uniref:G-protein coupled receptors family 1 profile domain-containing protein n=1 Tax=Spizellomyces punctatus (strain DAOM BR117) TaxID=645134 RepID=A0A0L0HS58_SPIPD|nr:uncharacterized protein SPPG_08933 [Spizellomyces punctatus DAOM BR117]KND03958.1 hypothetical protein SPPG_08933 [Spizellomyces punctatus DAOM BR117]|eukprot:XP_016611997.1 hypothetical protein SPPG_08933 [Spizellomyces punctatus DAOM BR117]
MTAETSYTANIGEWYPNTPAERAVNVVVLLINAVCVVGNVFLWCVWYHDRTLRTSIKSLLILNISFFDLAWAIFQVILKSWNVYHGAWASGVWSCQANSMMNNICQAVSMQTLMLVSLDRWMSIVKERSSKPADTYIMIINSWIVAIVFTILNVLASGNRPILAASHTYCDPDWMAPKWGQKAMGYFTIVCYVSFVLIMSFCYLSIFRKFRQSVAGLRDMKTHLSSTGARSTLKSDIMDSATSAGTADAVGSNTAGGPLPKDLLLKAGTEEALVMSKSTLNRSAGPEERALIRKFAILVTTFALTWGLWVFLILIPETVTNRMSSQVPDMLAAVGFPVNAAATPFLFILLDSRFKSAAKSLLRWS